MCLYINMSGIFDMQFYLIVEICTGFIYCIMCVFAIITRSHDYCRQANTFPDFIVIVVGCCLFLDLYFSGFVLTAYELRSIISCYRKA